MPSAAPFRRLHRLFADSPSLALVLVSRFGSTVAFQIQSVAVAWQVYEIARDPVALGYVGLAQFLPMMALTLVAGDVADRHERRTILALAYAVQGVATAGFLLLTLSRYHRVWPFYAVLALLGASRAFIGPALQSLVPLLVERERLAEAIGWNATSFQVAVIAGPAIGGGLYAMGPGIAYGTCLALFLGVAVALAGIRTRSGAKPVAGVTMIQRVAEGVAFVRRQPILLGAISLDLFAVLLGGASALLPAFARDILHVGPAGLGFLRSAPAVGAALVALGLSVYPLKRAAGPAMFASVGVFGLGTICFGLSEDILLSMAALAVLGAADMVSVYIRSTVIQLATPDAMRGRVSAVNMLFIGASNELGEFESGITAGWWGLVPAVLVGGVGTLVVAGLWMALFPALRRADRLSDVGA